MKIYVASSWRNGLQPAVVTELRAEGHEVYDFRNPREGEYGFSWKQLDEGWQSWDLERYRQALKLPIAAAGFKSDFEAMEWADAGVLVMPCGRSAHLEAGYFAGAKKPLLILLSEGEPELMYKMADHLCITMTELMAACRQVGTSFK